VAGAVHSAVDHSSRCSVSGADVLRRPAVRVSGPLDSLPELGAVRACVAEEIVCLHILTMKAGRLDKTKIYLQGRKAAVVLALLID
jgi:hypothetical protein